MREQFEKWVSSPPFEYSTERMTELSAWPGNYRYISVQLAWEAWQEARKAEFICSRCGLRKDSEYKREHEF